MAQFEIKDGVAVIPEGTATLENGVFMNCVALQSVVIPESVTEIGGCAFQGCSALQSIVIPGSVTKIGTCAFENCAALQSVVIPEGVTHIGNSAFRGCSSLRSIEIPASVEDIQWGVLNNCPALESIKVAEGNTEFDSRNDCNAIIHTASNELKNGCKSTVIPSSVTTIGAGAFEGCTDLKDIVIPDSVNTIKGNAFAGCTSLTKIVIPASVKQIESYGYCFTSVFFQPFNGCTNLTSIVVDEGNAVYDSPDNCNAIITKGYNSLEVGCATTVIPDSVQRINGGAFMGALMTDVTIPDSVKEIEWGAFHNCVNLKSVVLGKGLETIKGRSAQFMKPAAFSNCKSLESILLPASVRWVGESVFEDCDSLRSIVVEDGNAVFDSRENCNAVIHTRDNILKLGCQTTVIPESVVEIADSAFARCNGLTEITVPQNVIKMGGFVFISCKGLKSAAILGPVKDIGDPFVNCSSLESVTFGAGIKKMDDTIFSCTRALKRINVPAKKATYYLNRLPKDVQCLVVEMEPEKKSKK